MTEEKLKALNGRPASTWLNWTQEHVDMWNTWLAERPQVIRDMAAEHNLRFDRLYRLKSTGQRVILNSFFEDGTVAVVVREKFNADSMLPFSGLLDRGVFGINPADLEETDWEGELEEVEA